MSGAPHSVDRGIPGEHGGWRANQLRFRPHGAVLRHRELCPAACRGCQAVRHTDRAIAALLHGGQSQDGGIARCFLVGCVHRSGQRGARMKRREFITLLGGAAAWPLAARAQQGERTRRISVLSIFPEDDLESVARRAAFEQALQALGWTEGPNLRIDYRGSGNDPATIQKFVAELVALAPDVILASGNIAIAPMLRAAPTTPIVFAQVVHPVGSGFVRSMARPGGNVTGFTQFEYSLAGKWLELLKEIAPGVTRVAVVRDPTRGAGIGQFAVIQAMAPTHAVELTPINAND